MLPQHHRHASRQYRLSLDSPPNLHANIVGWQVDWKKAAADFGSASVESFKVMIRNALKKIDKADAANGGGDGAATPKSSAKKRKAAAAPADVDDEEGADTPIKKRGRPAKGSAKKAKTEAKAEEGGEGLPRL